MEVEAEQISTHPIPLGEGPELAARPYPFESIVKGDWCHDLAVGPIYAGGPEAISKSRYKITFLPDLHNDEAKG